MNSGSSRSLSELSTSSASPLVKYSSRISMMRFLISGGGLSASSLAASSSGSSVGVDLDLVGEPGVDTSTTFSSASLS